tara:strand:- start:2212 stop:2433 length:222 start_codon:yes stop_codon:yes gene_type:complete
MAITYFLIISSLVLRTAHLRDKEAIRAPGGDYSRLLKEQQKGINAHGENADSGLDFPRVNEYTNASLDDDPFV